MTYWDEALWSAARRGRQMVEAINGIMAAIFLACAVIARLKCGVSPTQGLAQVNVVEARIAMLSDLHAPPITVLPAGKISACSTKHQCR
jgi:hypothetical protein